jgi:YVTN family beta-propeller protein
MHRPADTSDTRLTDTRSAPDRLTADRTDHSHRSTSTSPAAAFIAAAAIAVAASAASRAAAQNFTNFESPQTHPIEVTPDGATLLAVNTADGQLEVFDLVGGVPVRRGSVAVGIDPVSVRARSSGEAWVVNQISDSVSVVDLASMRVTRTILVGDEPADIVFSTKPARAFVSLAMSSRLVSFDPAAATPTLTSTPIAGASPRALATSPDGRMVYLAIFESGNRSTVVPRATVNSPASPYAGANPPPNAGTAFDPPRTPGQPLPPRVAHIVRKNALGQWMDDNNRNWTGLVTWDVVDNDIAVVDAATLSTSYVPGLMSCVAGIGVAPNGTVLAVGIDARNEIRFEPKLNGVFARMVGAFSGPGGSTPVVRDLNPHLTYASSSIPELERTQSIGDPRGVAWAPDSSAAYVASLGTNCVIAMSPSGARLAKIPVGEGPSGVAMSPSGQFVYTLNRFGGSVSAVATGSASEVARVSFHDATPAGVRAGRRFLFDTNLTSGLGHASCATCHIDGRSDRLAWDLGDPTGAVEAFDEVCQVAAPGACIPWHPMKGPMTTQTLQGIIGNEPFHWRGEKDDLSEFNVAFTHLQGRGAELSAGEMASLQNYLASLVFPPNPNRNVDNTLRTSVAIFGGTQTGFNVTGNAVTGQNLFNTGQFFAGPPGAPGLTCTACHPGAIGSNNRVDIPAPGGENQNRKNAHLREIWRKVGASNTSTTALRGFGFEHNGEKFTFQDSITAGFTFANTATGQQQRRDIEAFCMSFNSGTHAGVGQQTTANGVANDTARINQFIAIANAPGGLGLIAKGRVDGLARGWTFVAGAFRPDRAGEPNLTPAALLALAGAGSELTYTLVPLGSQTRLGVDRDVDGFLDRDELDAGSDPADASSVPGACVADISPAVPDGIVNGGDLGALLSGWGASGITDLDGSGTTDAADLAELLGSWGPCS